MPVNTISSEPGVPAWALLTDAETRNLYKPEPPRKHLKEEERMLLKFYRKLSQEERMKVVSLANSLALARIKQRLAKGPAMTKAKRLIKEIAAKDQP